MYWIEELNVIFLYDTDVHTHVDGCECLIQYSSELHSNNFTDVSVHGNVIDCCSFNTFSKYVKNII